MMLMNKLIEIDGRWIQVLSKTIEINGDQVITDGEIRILNSANDDQGPQLTTYSHEHKPESSQHSA